ncbi:MAG: response regulator [Candidatus Omnitrophica bacterium]|nr:response regulator [Candidatus Omnitrophota bacterium]
MNRKILIVDDDKNTVLALKDIFESKGYSVLTAFSGKEALDKLGQGRLDLALLDIEMPDMSGMEILKVIKKRHLKLKTFMLSGFLDEYKQELDRRGCDAYLNKPFSVNTLVQMLEAILQEKAQDEDMIELFKDRRVQAKASLLFIEPNEIMYSPKLAYFQDRVRCGGEYQLAAAFSEEQISEKIKSVRPDIVISDINMFRLYRLEEKFLKPDFKPKDIILYGISAFGARSNGKGLPFVGGLFDPITAAVSPKKMDKLGQTVRNSAVARGLYIMVG